MSHPKVEGREHGVHRCWHLRDRRCRAGRVNRFSVCPSPVLLLVIQVLNVYKAAGLTPYGWRKSQRERLARSAA